MSKKNSQIKRATAYEVVVAAIHKQFAGPAVVTHNEKIRGRSGTLRQVDVAIRASIIGHPILLVVECKNHKNPIDINEVDELIGKVEDVDAALGVLVSDSGFTGGATGRAKTHGRIQLATVVDAANGDLRSKLRLPMMVTFSNVDPAYNVKFEVIPRQMGQAVPITKAELRNFIQRSECSIVDFLSWIASNEIQEKPTGTYKYRKIVESSTDYEIVLEGTVRKTLRSFVNDNIFADAVGIFEHLTRTFHGHINGTTLVEDDIIRSWREVPPDNEFAFKRYRRTSFPGKEQASSLAADMLRKLDNMS